jgi:sugar phosphate isomerase/epimerase
LADDTKIEEIKQILDDNNMSIAAISCHGNPVHPNKKIADEYHRDFENAVLLAEKLGVTTMVGFSGCPGDCETSTRPNWVTCSWPNDYLETLDWQWNEVLIPYWKKEAEFCKSHGIEKIAFEMHPGFCVYNTSSLLKLRKAVGDIRGANVDPSHLLWQGMDPVEVIKVLGKENAIHHFHAKDTKIDCANTSVNGVLDVGSYADILGRSWVFRTVGYGNGKEMWNNIISTLKAVGYDGVISIEHEDSLMSPKEGLEKAIAFLKDVIIYESPAEMWWI